MCCMRHTGHTAHTCCSVGYLSCRQLYIHNGGRKNGHREMTFNLVFTQAYLSLLHKIPNNQVQLAKWPFSLLCHIVQLNDWRMRQVAISRCSLGTLYMCTPSSQDAIGGREERETKGEEGVASDAAKGEEGVVSDAAKAGRRETGIQAYEYRVVEVADRSKRNTFSCQSATHLLTGKSQCHESMDSSFNTYIHTQVKHKHVAIATKCHVMSLTTPSLQLSTQ